MTTLLALIVTLGGVGIAFWAVGREREFDPNREFRRLQRRLRRRGALRSWM